MIPLAFEILIAIFFTCPSHLVCLFIVIPRVEMGLWFQLSVVYFNCWQRLREKGRERERGGIEEVR